MGQVMIKFKKNYYKMMTKGNKLQIRIANYRADSEYISDAFKSDTDKDCMYIAAYPASKRGDNPLGSSSSDTPITDTLVNLRELRDENYELYAYDKYKYLYCLLAILTKSLDFNKKIGTGASVDLPNGTMNTAGLFYGDSDPNHGNKVLGIENLWSRLGTLTEGIIKNNDILYYKSHTGFTEDIRDYRPILPKIGMPMVLGSGFVSKWGTDVLNTIMYPTSLHGSSTTYTTAYYHSESIIDNKNYHYTIGSSINDYIQMGNVRSDLDSGQTRLVL